MYTHGRFFVCVLCILQVLFFTVPQSEGFGIPERLVYDLSWTGIKAGTATMEIRNDRDEMHIISTAFSAKWISAFYPVEDRVESVMEIGRASCRERV